MLRVVETLARWFATYVATFVLIVVVAMLVGGCVMVAQPVCVTNCVGTKGGM